jgi:hypothetical protein
VSGNTLVHMIGGQIVMRLDSREKFAVKHSTKVDMIQVLHVDDEAGFLGLRNNVWNCRAASKRTLLLLLMWPKER